MQPLEKMVRIKFDTGSISAGSRIALFSDSVIYTGRRDEFIVPEKTVRLLEAEEGIKFSILTDVSG